MIRPGKHSNLDLSILGVSAHLLASLQKKRILTFERIMEIARKKYGADTQYVLMPSLSFLYLVKRIVYHLDTDSFEYRVDPRPR